MKTGAFTLLKLCIAVLSIYSFAACKKSSASLDNSSSFTWTWNGTAFTGNFKEAFQQSMSTTPIIISGTGTTLISAGSGPRISVNSLSVGTYTLGSGLTNTISFIAPNGDVLQSMSGTLNITANANNRLAGNFAATLVNGSSQTSSFMGSFINIKISP